MSIGKRITLCSFLGLLFFISTLSVILPGKAFSERELRYLEKRPEMSLKGILSGRFMGQYQDYVDDQFPLRDSWVFLKTDIERFLGKKENNGIIFGLNDYLFPRFEVNEDKLLNNTGYIQEFIEELKVPASFILVPQSTSFYPEYLPDGLLQFEKEAWEMAEDLLGEKMLDVWALLHEHKDEDIFFRTDHHWTMRGAYYVYARWMQEKGEVPKGIDEFTKVVVSRDFLGSHYSRANLRHVSPDEIEVFCNREENSLKVYYQDSVSDSLYNPSHLGTRDQYSYFLDGNHPLIKIETDLEEGRSVLVIKDSYAHSFVPFLTSHYKEIHVMDMRYYAGSPLRYVEGEEIDEVLLLFGLGKFNESMNLHRVVAK